MISSTSRVAWAVTCAFAAASPAAAWEPSASGLLLAERQNGLLPDESPKTPAAAAAALLEAIEDRPSVLAVLAAGSLRGGDGPRLEAEVARALAGAGGLAATPISRDLGEPTGADNASLLAHARAGGAEAVIVLRALPSAGPRVLLLQLVDERGIRGSAQGYAARALAAGGDRLVEDPASLDDPPPALRSAGGAAAEPPSSPSLVDDAESAEAIDAFEDRALRFTTRNPFQVGSQPMGLVSRDGGFAVWGPHGERLDRAEALRHVGEDELADRQALAVTVGEWQLPIQLGAMGVFLVGGALAGGALLASLPPEANEPFGPAESITMGATLGMTLGSLAYLGTVFPIGMLTPRLLAVDDDTAHGVFAEHNLKTAEDVGLARRDIPFEFLAY
jgi:hypothetical protein